MKTFITLAFAALFAVAAPLAAHAAEGCKAPRENSAKEDHSGCGVPHAGDAKGAGAVYRATGAVKRVDKSTGKVVIAHDPIAELKWPAMTMSFGVSDRKLLDEVAAGKKVDFRFVQRGDDFIVTALY